MHAAAGEGCRQHYHKQNCGLLIFFIVIGLFETVKPEPLRHINQQQNRLAPAPPLPLPPLPLPPPLSRTQLQQPQSPRTSTGVSSFGKKRRKDEGRRAREEKVEIKIPK